MGLSNSYKKITVYLAKDFVCKNCGSMVKNLKGPDEIVCDGVNICN